MQYDRSGFLKRARQGVIVWAVTTVLFTAVFLVSDIGEHKSLAFILYANGVNIALWRALLPLISRSVTLFPLNSGWLGANSLTLLLIVTVLAALQGIVFWAVVYATYFPYRSSYPSFLGLLRSELFRFMPFDILIGVVMVVAVSGWRAWQALQEERARAKDLERQLAVARLHALRMQLQPHFLFNTLHTVAGLTIEEPALARRMVIALGDLLRMTLKEPDKSLRTLAEELEYSDLYLGIEKLRLGDRLVLNYELDPSAARALVPQLLLQPLFENAIRHGAARMTDTCEVHFSASRKAGTLQIIVRNDGPRRVSSSPHRFGVGLGNTLDRLRLFYGNRHELCLSDRPEGGAQIEISIPYQDASDAEVTRPGAPWGVEDMLPAAVAGPRLSGTSP